MIVFLYGADAFRSRRLLQETIARFRQEIDPDSHSFSVIDGASASLTEINEKINTGSLFTRKRLVVIENIFKNKKAGIFSGLLEYLGKLNDSRDTTVVFWDENLETSGKAMNAEAKKLFSFLGRLPFAQEFKLLDNRQLLQFVKQEAASHGKNIGAAAAGEIIAAAGQDLWQISREVRKLAFASQEKSIESSLVKEMVKGQFSEDIFALTDAISAKDKTLAARLLAEQYAAGASDEYLLTMLSRQFRILLQIKTALENGLDQNALSRELKLHPFVAKKGIWQAKNFSLEALKKILDRLIELDCLNKTGTRDIGAELALIIASL